MCAAQAIVSLFVQTLVSPLARRRTVPGIRPLMLLLALYATPHAARAACGGAPTRETRVAAINAALEITTSDGEILTLAGVEPPAPSPQNPSRAEDTRRRLSDWLIGRTLGLVDLGPGSDRWGRRPVEARAEVEAGRERIDVGAALVEAGLARASMTPPNDCFLRLRALEDGARDAALGLWSDPFYDIIEAADRDALRAQNGHVVIVEGTVISIGQGRLRTYLNFGDRRLDLSLTVANRDIVKLQKSRLAAADLKGRALRVRGRLDFRFGPQIDITNAQQVEFIATEPSVAEQKP